MTTRLDPLRRLAGVVALVFAAPVLLAGSGFDRDADYRGQGADWYGRAAGPEQKRDYAPTVVDLVNSGDDYCAGYEPLFEYLDLGPILQRTNEADYEYDFRFEYFPPCFDDGAVVCNDGIACTVDTFDAASAECLSVAPAPPDEVQNLRLNDMPGAPEALLSWNAEPAAESYDVYRAAAIDLVDLSCLFASVAGTSTLDDGQLPAPSQVFYMLVTARNCTGQSTLGFGTLGERDNDSPCP